MSRSFKNAIYEQFSRIGKALANEHRLELLDVLAQGERTVEELATETAMTVANASQHLQVLRKARLVARKKKGTYGFYRLADERVFRLWQVLREVGEARLAEVRQLAAEYRENREQLEGIGMEELLERLRKRDVVVLDVRPPEEYRAGHVPGARSVPLGELEARLDELPSGVEVVAYCRGPYCVMADEAVERLQERGFRARRLEVGFPDWKAADLPVEAQAG